MAASPADISAYTNDGIVLVKSDQAIKDAHPNADDLRDAEVEMFFVSEAAGQALLDERFSLLSTVEPVHERIEVAEDLGIGQDIAVTPVIPTFTIIDATRDLTVNARCYGYAIDLETDREAIAVIE